MLRLYNRPTGLSISGVLRAKLWFPRSAPPYPPFHA
jgi:hypothetical protein